VSTSQATIEKPKGFQDSRMEKWTTMPQRTGKNSKNRIHLQYAFHQGSQDHHAMLCRTASKSSLYECQIWIEKHFKIIFFFSEGN